MTASAIVQIIIGLISLYAQYKEQHPDAPNIDAKTKEDLSSALKQFAELIKNKKVCNDKL